MEEMLAECPINKSPRRQNGGIPSCVSQKVVTLIGKGPSKNWTGVADRVNALTLIGPGRALYLNRRVEVVQM